MPLYCLLFVGTVDLKGLGTKQNSICCEKNEYVILGLTKNLLLIFKILRWLELKQRTIRNQEFIQ
jgi:hypothetical protein